MSRWKKLIELLRLQRSIAGVLTMVVLVGTGEKLGERFLPIYLVALGGGLLAPGVFSAVNNLVDALYSYPGGWLADRVGLKRSLIIFNFISIAGFLLVAAVPHWTVVIPAALLFLSWSSISLPASMGLISNVLPKNKQVLGVSLHSLVKRFPAALGPVIGGIFIDRFGPVTGVRLAFGCAAVLALIALVMQQVLIEGDKKGDSQQTENNPLRLLGSFSAELKKLLVADILIRFCEQIPYAYVVIWCMRAVPGYHTALVSGTDFGLLTTIEMATAVLCYLPVAKYADQGSKKPFVVITFINFALFPLVLFYSRSFGWLVAAFIVRGMKEFGEPTRKALILDLAPAQRKAAAFGAYYLVRDTIVSLAALGGGYLWALGPGANFLSAFAFGAVGAFWFGLAGRDNFRKQDSLNAAAA